MGSVASRALLVAALLASPGTALAGQDPPASVSRPVGTVVGVAAGSAAGAGAEAADRNDRDDDDPSPGGQQLLSTLGALALGLLGLVLIRRRAA